MPLREASFSFVPSYVSTCDSFLTILVVFEGVERRNQRKPNVSDL